MPNWLCFLMIRGRVPSIWLLRPLSIITAFLLATQVPEIEKTSQRIFALIGLSAILVWCFIWLVWHLKDQMTKR